MHASKVVAPQPECFNTDSALEKGALGADWVVVDVAVVRVSAAVAAGTWHPYGGTTVPSPSSINVIVAVVVVAAAPHGRYSALNLVSTRTCMYVYMYACMYSVCMYERIHPKYIHTVRTYVRYVRAANVTLRTYIHTRYIITTVKRYP